jgi:hypothetical protein
MLIEYSGVYELQVDLIHGSSLRRNDTVTDKGLTERATKQ